MSDKAKGHLLYPSQNQESITAGTTQVNTESLIAAESQKEIKKKQKKGGGGVVISNTKPVQRFQGFVLFFNEPFLFVSCIK